MTIEFIINNSVNGTIAAIPLTITQVTQSSWPQYLFSLLLSSLITLWFFKGMIDISLENIRMKMKLAKFRSIVKKPVLFINHVNEGLFGGDMINRQMIPKLNTILSKFDNKPFALILNTPGGDVFASMLISKMLRYYPQKIDVYVPNYAMSGGTLLALSCDNIHMNEYSCLGPIDPQLGGLLSYGPAAGWKDVMRIKGNKANDQSIIYKRLGQQVENTIRNHVEWLVSGKCREPKQWAEYLTEGNVEHIYQIDMQALTRAGFNVTPILDNEAKELNKILRTKSLNTMFWMK